MAARELIAEFCAGLELVEEVEEDEGVGVVLNFERVAANEIGTVGAGR